MRSIIIALALTVGLAQAGSSTNAEIDRLRQEQGLAKQTAQRLGEQNSELCATIAKRDGRIRELESRLADANKATADAKASTATAVKGKQEMFGQCQADIALLVKQKKGLGAGLEACEKRNSDLVGGGR